MNIPVAATKRELLINIILNELTDEQVETVLSNVRGFLAENVHHANYQPEQDPILLSDGLFDGPGDLAGRTEDILQSDSTLDNA